MMPVLPHFANECLEMINSEKALEWPTYDKNKLTLKDVCKSLFVAVGIVAICIIFIIPLTIIPELS